MSITIVKPGLLTTVQDLGRRQQILGISPSGAMDTYSHRLSNWLLGNDEHLPTLEITMFGPSILFHCNAVIAITGAHLSPSINGKPIGHETVVQVHKHDVLEFGRPITGARAYLAFYGGIQISSVFDSTSTDVRSKIGGLHGLPLQKKDKLTISPSKLVHPIRWGLLEEISRLPFKERTIRYTKGKQHSWFEPECSTTFQTNRYIITFQSNRMGYRLDGPTLSLSQSRELLSEGVSFGTVQVPASGLPIVLMAERQTTGGYPKFAQISAIDLPYLAQQPNGASLTFREITIQESQHLLHSELQRLSRLKGCLLNRSKGAIVHEEIN